MRFNLKGIPIGWILKKGSDIMVIVASSETDKKIFVGQTKNICVICGREIPEGREVCPICEKSI